MNISNKVLVEKFIFKKENKERLKNLKSEYKNILNEIKWLENLNLQLDDISEVYKGTALQFVKNGNYETYVYPVVKTNKRDALVREANLSAYIGGIILSHLFDFNIVKCYFNKLI